MDIKKFEEMIKNEMKIEKMKNMEIIIEEKDCIECVCDNCNNNCCNKEKKD